LALNGNGFIGRRGDDAVEFVESRSVESAAERAAHMASAFSAGAKFKGRLLGMQQEDLGGVMVTIAEIRDSGAYVRATAHATDTPQDVVVYEGRLRTERALVDGYCLELFKRTRGARTENLLNDNVQPISLLLRLTTDGGSVRGVVLNQPGTIVETMKLSPVPADLNAVSLAAATYGPFIRSKFTKGATWRGQYKNPEKSKTGDVALRVLDATEDGLTVEITSATLPGGRVEYEGLLRLDDVNLNAHCALLRKSVGGKPPVKRPPIRTSATPPPLPQPTDMFDTVTGRDRMLFLSFAADGETLLGVTGMNDQVQLQNAEYLTLRSTTRPAGASPAISSSPSSSTAPPLSSASSGAAQTPFGTVTPAFPLKWPPGPARTWTSADGRFSIQASLVRAIAGNLTLKRLDGEMIDVPISKLSAADQDYLSKTPAPAN
jgi:hypothetical protein